MNKLRMLLLNGFGNNLGDQAIFAGFGNAFEEASNRVGVDIQVEQSFIYNFRFRDSNIDAINEAYDLIMLGGGGFIYHRAHDDSPSGWGFNISEEILERLTVPLAVYGSGYNFRAYAPEAVPSYAASHLR